MVYFIPVIYWLLKKKTQSTYESVLSILTQKCLDLNLVLNPLTLL